MPYDPASRTGDESFLLRAAEIFGRRRLLAAVVFAVVVASALSFALYLPDLYRSRANVLVERQLPEEFVRPAVSGELESRLHVIKQEILTRARLTELIDRFNLYEDLRTRGDMDAVFEQMRSDIQIETTGPEQVSSRTKTVAFNLTYTGADAATVADVTNAIAAFYVAQNDQMRSEQAARATQFLKEQVADAKQQLEKNEGAVRAYTTRHVGELPEQVGVNLATIDRLNTQLRLNGERQLRALEARERVLEDAMPLPAASAAAPAPSPAAERLEKLKQDLEQTEARFTSKHPDVLRLRSEIANLEREAAEEPPAPVATMPQATIRVPTRRSARSVESIDAEIEQLKRDDAALRDSIATVERRLAGVPNLQNEFGLISRDHQSAKDLYESLLKRYEEAQLAESMESGRQGERFRVLESATPPDGPSAPNRPRLLLMGLFLGVLAAGLAVLAAEQFDTSFHSVDDVRAFTSVPVLVAIPRLGPPAGRRVLRAAGATVSLVACLYLVVVVCAYLARGNEQLVRLLVRGS